MNTKKPWVVKYEEESRSFVDIICRKLAPSLKALKKRPLEAIVKKAVAQKKYDIYHSTTIEGYHITPEEVEAVILGKEITGKSAEKIKNKMAIIGHSQAFDYVISKIKKDYRKAAMSEDFIAEIYFSLFKPSVDAKIIDRFDLLGYRNTKVYLHNSRYVPPAAEKVDGLMKSFVATINQIDNLLVKAILAHYYFVTIHPYPDGNGRCGRLIMNYFLAASGYPWITITAEKRDQYFQALQAGQLNSDIIPFARFIVSFLEKKKRDN